MGQKATPTTAAPPALPGDPGAEPAANQAASGPAPKSRRRRPVATPAPDGAPTDAPAPPVDGPPPAPERFDAATLTAIRAGLTVQREELQQQLMAIEETTSNQSQSEMSGEVSFDEDSADAGSFTFEREKDLSIANNISDLRRKIDRAVRRIDEGTYGICDSCGRPIEGPRLTALPHVTLCLSCKKREERR